MTRHHATNIKQHQAGLCVPLMAHSAGISIQSRKKVSWNSSNKHGTTKCLAQCSCMNSAGVREETIQPQGFMGSQLLKGEWVMGGM
jgi:hypothetical protein